MDKNIQRSEPDDHAGVAEAIRLDVVNQIGDKYLARGRSPHSPEARAEKVEKTLERQRQEGLVRRSYAHVAPGTRPFEIIKRVAVGTYTDGFIHAGNLAYLSLIALFPFFITAAAILGTIGEPEDRLRAIAAILSTMPPGVADTLRDPLREVITTRTGWLLWLSAGVGLWTVGSLIETMRDILRRAYGTQFNASFWQYRLYSIGLIVASVMLLLVSFSAQVLITGFEEFIERVLPDQIDGITQIAFSRGLSGLGLFVALYLLFYTLTPSKYRKHPYPKWPGALFVTLWWIAVTLALPPLLSSLLSYDATYGSLAGVMVALFFFYLIGLGVVVGAELNAALVETGLETASHDDIGQSDNRERKGQE
jgi:membrane protein